ncbi:hypothetical protein ACFW81_23775 [Streptomyces angustmyceticus]|uniref:hypothetical protein n=1 Tax=Streptomyces angustmyceticus TaxID=285578 RepID=UPI0036C54D06
MHPVLSVIALTVSLIALGVAIRCAIDTRGCRIRAEASADRARRALAEIEEIHRELRCARRSAG